MILIYLFLKKLIYPRTYHSQSYLIPLKMRFLTVLALLESKHLLKIDPNPHNIYRY